jgi:dipeptidyl aminopeptidase/acylaminoacyl peptidase
MPPRRLLIALLVLTLAGPAKAAFPGANGPIVLVRTQLATRAATPTPTPEPPATASGLYALSAGALTRVSSLGYELSPTFAPDGRTLMFAHSGEVCFLRLEVAGPACTINLPNGGYVSNPAWSPDAARIVFNTGAGLYVMNVDGSGLHQIVGDRNAQHPAWSPDGGRIAFDGTPTSDSGDRTDLYTVNPDGSDLRHLTDTPDAYELAPDWAPDGSRVVYQTGEAELRTIAADGTDDRALGSGWAPVYSPDGTLVAAAAGADGGLTHIVTIPAAGGAPTAVTGDSRFSDYEVTWGRVADPLPTPTPSPTPTPTPTPQGSGEITSVPRRGRWVRPRRADGFKPTRLTRRSRRARIELRVPGCGSLDHVAVRRHPHAVVITVVYRVLVGNGYAVPACTMPFNRARTVSLKGRLGRRAIQDGSTTPPRTRYRRVAA